MKKISLLFLLFFVLPSVCSAYAYKSISCSCPLPDSNMTGVVQLSNSGGMNIFYFAGSGGDQVTQNLYANVTKLVRFPVHCSSGGSYVVDVSANYNDNYDLTCETTEYSEPLQHYSIDTIQGLVGVVCAGFFFLAIIYGMKP